MKIHGKILSHYLTCSAPVVKEGYLYKKGEVNTSYQKRWVTLKGNLLYYQERPRDREVLGVIVLEGCSVQLCESEEQFAFSLVFSDAGLRTYKFSAESQASQESWIKILHSSHHSFLSILLQDLHNQYRQAARAAGVEPVDCSRLMLETMAHSQKLNQGSVFYSVPDIKGPGGPGNNQLLQVPPIAAKHASKRSPKLWPKRHAHVTPVSGPAPPPGEWSEPTEDFSTMHEEFGREVKRLVDEWRRRGKEAMALPEGDLIDLG